jgi:phage gp29-like protein
MNFMFPEQPSADMDELLEIYSMPVDLSKIQPFEHVRDLLGFYASEASRALVSRAVWRGRLRHLKDALDDAKTDAMSSSEAKTRWSTQLQAATSPKVRRIVREMTYVENVIELLTALYEKYNKDSEDLSREITARREDRDRWYGRAGEKR